MADSKPFRFGFVSPTPPCNNPGNPFRKRRGGSHRSSPLRTAHQCQTEPFSSTAFSIPSSQLFTSQSCDDVSANLNLTQPFGTGLFYGGANGSLTGPDSVPSSEIRSPSGKEAASSEVKKQENEPIKETSPSQEVTVVSRILYGIPQNPHFLQLKTCSGVTKKNLIAGWDQTFEQTVEMIRSLKPVDGFWVKATELWRSMSELESIGYNVIVLRRRLVELADVMIQLGCAEMEIKRLRVRAENHRMEKSRLENVVLNLQAMAKREELRMENLLVEAENKEEELPKICCVLAKLALEPLPLCSDVAIPKDRN